MPVYPKLNMLALVFDPEDDFGVVPFVDGTALFSDWAGTALFPYEVLCDPSPLLPVCRTVWSSGGAAAATSTARPAPSSGSTARLSAGRIGE
jgi:hypothetical protein